jgi:hypothetical protein
LRLLERQGARPVEGSKALSQQYERLAAQDRDLRLGGKAGPQVVVGIYDLSRCSAGKVEENIRKALKDKGYDPLLIDLLCQRVREQLSGAAPE